MVMVRGLLVGLALVLMTAFAGAADRAIIVLDASGSMWGQIDGKPKLEIARETLGRVLATVPSDLELGLLAYGHRDKGSCEDIELVVPPRAGSGADIVAAVNGMRFLGKTPLTAAVRQAAEAMRYTEDKATVILITDGIETCNADPCALASELEQNGIDFTAHVVGFGLTADEGKQVACLAEGTGGKYLQASDQKGLEEAIVAAVVIEPAPEPEPEPAPAPEPQPGFNIVPTATFSEGGPLLGADDDMTWVVNKANADGSSGEYVSTDYGAWKGNLEPGNYVLKLRVGHAEREQPVTIEPGKVAEPHFVLDAGRLIIRARASEGAEIAEGASIAVKYPGSGNTTYYGQMKAVFPAGDQQVTVRLGEGEVAETIKLAAGQTVEKDIVVGVGRLVVNAYYKEGMKVDSGGLAVRIFKAQKKIDGTREDVTYGYGPDTGYDLPPGDYAVVAQMEVAEAETQVSVKVAELTEAGVVLNAGVLAMDAPGAQSIEIFSAARDIQGNRKSLAVSYDAKWQQTLPAGDYAVVKRLPSDERVEVQATVRAGERTEISIP